MKYLRSLKVWKHSFCSRTNLTLTLFPGNKAKTIKEKMMTKHKTGTREEWLESRLKLLESEKELTRRSDELAQRRQELPWVRIDKEYRFDTDEGNILLPDLFKGR